MSGQPKTWSGQLPLASFQNALTWPWPGSIPAVWPPFSSYLLSGPYPAQPLGLSNWHSVSCDPQVPPGYGYDV